MAMQRINQTSLEKIEHFQCGIARARQKEIPVGMKRHTVHRCHVIYTNASSIDILLTLLFLLA